MKQTTIDRVAWLSVFLAGFIIIAGFVLLGWAFIEIVQWIISK